MLKKLLPKTRNKRTPMFRSKNMKRRNSRAIVTIVVRLVINILFVLLQERTKTKIKAKAKIQANIVEEMEDADELCAMILE